MNGRRNSIPVEVHNPSKQEIVIPPKTTICSLSHVSIVEELDGPGEQEIQREVNSLSFDFGQSHMNKNQRSKALELLDRWSPIIFSQGHFFTY
jgi:hypothetical protein